MAIPAAAAPADIRNDRRFKSLRVIVDMITSPQFAMAARLTSARHSR
jgi:hypothetical protein